MNSMNETTEAPKTIGRKKTILFCDFDGTITESDNIVAIMKHFNPPGWEDIVQELIDKKTTLRDCVGRMFDLFPSSMKEEIVSYAINNAVIRGGFPELLEYCRKHDIEFYVTSGGIDFFIYPLLAPYHIPNDHIFCNGSDFEGDRVTITWPNRCDDHCHADCGMCKTSIIRSFSSDEYQRILIGDSISDFEGAKLVDLVFARSHLIDLCKELNLPYHEFSTFHDVVAQLEVIRQS